MSTGRPPARARVPKGEPSREKQVEGAEKPGRRAIRQQQRRELSRGQVLEAAEALFARKGFQETTVREVAELAEFSVGAVYSFFESKEEIFTQIIERRSAEFADGTRAVLDRQLPAREQLHRLADFQIQFFRRNRNFARLWLRSSSLTSFEMLGSVLRDPDASRAWDPLLLQRDLFVHGQACGEIRAGDPNVLAMLFSGLVYAYQSTDPLVLEDNDQPVERLPLGIFHDVLDGAFRR
jgi:TetR/AcrR family transcriptional regulator